MSETHPPGDAVQTTRRWLWIILSIAALAAVIGLLWEVEDTADVTQRSAQPKPPVVTVVEVQRAQARASVSAFAELRPRWKADIRAAVSGRIVEVHKAALAGTRVTAGTRLFSIERTQFETEVADAEAALEQARLTLMQAENQVTVAERLFKADGTEPPNELALKLPQLRIAQKGLVAAEVKLKAATRQLADTEVRAPFSGFVTTRMASLGQTVTPGEALLQLSDDRQFELVVDLNKDQWSLLQRPVSGTAAQLLNKDGRVLGQARIREGGGFLDPDTRQIRVFLDVSGSQSTLLSGDFLRVVFTGKLLDDTLTLPEASLTREGLIWFVTEDDLLKRIEPVILFRSGNKIVIEAPADEGSWKVAKSPLASFLPGQRVTPISGEG